MSLCLLQSNELTCTVGFCTARKCAVWTLWLSTSKNLLWLWTWLTVQLLLFFFLCPDLLLCITSCLEWSPAEKAAGGKAAVKKSAGNFSSRCVVVSRNLALQLPKMQTLFRLLEISDTTLKVVGFKSHSHHSLNWNEDYGFRWCL